MAVDVVGVSSWRFGVLFRNDGPGVRGVDVKQDVDEEEEEESKAVEDEDVSDVRDVGGGHERHLFFRRAHKEEARCVKKLTARVSAEWRDR